MSRIVDRALKAFSRVSGYDLVARRDADSEAMRLSHYHALAEAVRHPLSPDLQARVFLLGRLLVPRRALGREKLRIGGEQDGGYVMLDDFASVKTAFSLGIGPNVDWDHDIAERGIEVWQFDHTVADSPRQHRLFRFNKRRIDGRASAETEDLVSLLAKHGSPEPFSNLLKVDIEGSEWDFFSSANDAALGVFPQIVCEFHGLAEVYDDVRYHRMVDALTRLRRTFEVVHIHGNNIGGRVFAADQALPNVLEVTFAHKDRYTFVDESGPFPTALDRRCDRSLPDYDLGDFAFSTQPALGLKSLASRTLHDVMFDSDAYRAANPDLDIPGEKAWLHWRLWGWREGRPLSSDEYDFDPDAYLTANPDVAAAGFDALTHWRHFGRKEGRCRTMLTGKATFLS